MANGHPVIALKVLAALEASGVFERAKEIQHATQMTARYGITSAFILVFDTGAVVVQGQPSALKTWLQQIKECIRTGKEIPTFSWPRSDTPPESGATTATG